MLLGGGGDAAAEQEAWTRFLACQGKILYWPFALGEPPLSGAPSWFASQLRALGGADREFDTWMSLDAHDPGELVDYAVLCVGGGNTFSLLDHVRRHGFLPAVRDWVERGGAYYGGSAGAILATSSIAIAEVADPNDVGLVDLAGLGLLPTRGLLPHFDTSQIGRARLLSARLATPILGLPENSGLLLDSSEIRVLGPASATLVSGEAITEYPAGSPIPVADLS